MFRNRFTDRRIAAVLTAALMSTVISPLSSMAAYQPDPAGGEDVYGTGSHTEHQCDDAETGVSSGDAGIYMEDANIDLEQAGVFGAEEESGVIEAPGAVAEDEGEIAGEEIGGAGEDGSEDALFEDEHGIVFENLDEVEPVKEIPENVLNGSGEAVVGSDGTLVTAESEKYIPIGHRNAVEGDGTYYKNYHTTAKQQSISADAVNNKRTYINETCWAFATMGALEASYNIHNGISNAVSENRGLTTADGALDLSERAIAYFTYFNDNRVTPDSMKTLEKDNNYLYIGSTDISTAKKATIPQAFALGGAPGYAMENLAMGIGPVTEEQVPYSTESRPKLNHEAVDGKYKFGTEYALREGKIIDMAQKDKVKEMILRYGGVSTSIYYLSKYLNTVSDNAGRSVYFHHPSAAQNHNVLIVGWDDTIKPGLFANGTHTSGSEEAGGWLCKNSYGNEKTARNNTGMNWAYEYGYFWVSYDSTDQLLANNGVRRGYIFDIETLEGADEGVSENRTYQYDGSAFSKEITAGSTYANVYNVASLPEGSHEYLRSVMVKLATPGSVYSVQVYADPEAGNPEMGQPLLKSPVYGKVDAAGYYTLDLGRGIELAARETFSVVVTLYKSNAGDDTPGIYSGVSGKFTMSVAKNSLIVPEDSSSATVPAMYYCLNSTKAGHSMLYNTSTKQWEDMFNNEDSQNIHGNLRIKLRTVTRKGTEEVVAPDYTVIDHFEKKVKDTGTTAQPIITLEDAEDESGTTILYVGQTAIIRAGSAYTADWSSKKTKIATVDQDGLVTAVKKGVTQISAVVDGKEYTHRIMVRNPSFVTTRMKLPLTNSYVLGINGKYQDVIWESAKPDVVSVNSVTGEVSALRDGASVIKAQMGKTVLKCKVSVPKLTLNAKSVTLAPEAPTWHLKPESKKVSMEGAEYEIADPGIVEVDKNGVLRAAGNGKTFVTVRVGGAFARCVVEVMGY